MSRVLLQESIIPPIRLTLLVNLNLSNALSTNIPKVHDAICYLVYTGTDADTGWSYTMVKILKVQVKGQEPSWLFLFQSLVD